MGGTLPSTVFDTGIENRRTDAICWDRLLTPPFLTVPNDSRLRAQSRI